MNLKSSTRAPLASLVILAITAPAICSAAEPAKYKAESILVCARTLIDSKRGGTDGIKKAADLIARVRDNSSNLGALTEIEADCKASLKNLPSARLSRQDQFEAAEKLGGTCSAKVMLEDFIKPRLVCHKVGAAASAAGMFGLGVKIDGGKCDSSDGRRWLALSLGLAYGAGIGLEVDVNGGKMSTSQREPYSWNPFSAQSSIAFTRGFILEKKGETPDENLKDNPWEMPVVGGGVGLGWVEMVFGQVNLKLVPLGTNGDALYENLMRDDASSCKELSRAEPAGQGDAAQATALLDDSTRGQSKTAGDAENPDASNTNGSTAFDHQQPAS